MNSRVKVSDPALIAASGEPRAGGTSTLAPLSTHNLQRVLASLPHTRFPFDLEFTLTNVWYGASGAPLSGAIAQLTVSEAINYIQISPSDRGNDVAVVLGSTFFRWKEHGNGVDRVVVPRADFLVRGQDSTREFSFPVRRNWSFGIIVIPAETYAVPYTDGVRIVVGYRPIPAEYALLELENE